MLGFSIFAVDIRSGKTRNKSMSYTNTKGAVPLTFWSRRRGVISPLTTDDGTLHVGFAVLLIFEYPATRFLTHQKHYGLPIVPYASNFGDILTVMCDVD